MWGTFMFRECILIEMHEVVVFRAADGYDITLKGRAPQCEIVKKLSQLRVGHARAKVAQR